MWVHFLKEIFATFGLCCSSAIILLKLLKAQSALNDWWVAKLCTTYFGSKDIS